VYQHAWASLQIFQEERGMRVKKLWVVGSAFLIVLLAAPGALAQILNPRVTVSGGGSLLRGERTFVVGSETFNTQYVVGGRLKGRLTLDLTKHWSVEGVYGFGANNLQITEQGTTPGQRFYGIREHQVQFNILRFFSVGERAVRPFLITGMGLERFSPTDQAKAAALASNFIASPAPILATNKPSVAFGGGIEAQVTRWFGLRLDVKDRLSAVPRYGLPQTSSGTGGAFFPVDGLAQNIEAEVGIVFYLLR
jgi:hypothetical protein